MVEGFVDYRHPVQGWTMPLPVADVENAPEVFYAKGTRMERADMAAPDRRDALALHVARTLQKRMAPGAWELLRSDRREHYLALGRLVVESLDAEGAIA